MTQTSNPTIVSLPSMPTNNLSLAIEAIITPFYNLCEYCNLIDLGRKTDSESFEFIWLQSLKKLSENEGSIKAQEKIKEVLKDAVALQVSSLEFAQENDYLALKYNFDESIPVEEESIEAFKVNYEDGNSLYQLSVQFPTGWSVALNKEATLQGKIKLMHALVKESLSSTNSIANHHSSKLNSFFIQRDKIDPKTLLPVCTDSVNLANLNTSNLNFLHSALVNIKKDTQVINSFISSPSFTSYEKSREIVPQIIAQTKFSILKKPAFEQLAALEMQLLGERIKKKFK